MRRASELHVAGVGGDGHSFGVVLAMRDLLVPAKTAVPVEEASARRTRQPPHRTLALLLQRRRKQQHAALVHCDPREDGGHTLKCAGNVAAAALAPSRAPPDRPNSLSACPAVMPATAADLTAVSAVFVSIPRAADAWQLMKSSARRKLVVPACGLGARRSARRASARAALPLHASPHTSASAHSSASSSAVRVDSPCRLELGAAIADSAGRRRLGLCWRVRRRPAGGPPSGGTPAL